MRTKTKIIALIIKIICSLLLLAAGVIIISEHTSFSVAAGVLLLMWSDNIVKSLNK